MSVEFEVFDVIPASLDQVYAAWLDSDEHSAMTGSPARVSANVGGEFEAWNAISARLERRVPHSYESLLR